MAAVVEIVVSGAAGLAAANPSALSVAVATAKLTARVGEMSNLTTAQ
jgi:hypothetical protein